MDLARPAAAARRPGAGGSENAPHFLSPGRDALQSQASQPRDPHQEAIAAVVRLVQKVAPEQQMAWLDGFRTDIEVALPEEHGRRTPMD